MDRDNRFSAYTAMNPSPPSSVLHEAVLCSVQEKGDLSLCMFTYLEARGKIAKWRREMCDFLSFCRDTVAVWVVETVVCAQTLQ